MAFQTFSNGFMMVTYSVCFKESSTLVKENRLGGSRVLAYSRQHHLQVLILRLFIALGE